MTASKKMKGDMKMYKPDWNPGDDAPDYSEPRSSDLFANTDFDAIAAKRTQALFAEVDVAYGTLNNLDGCTPNEVLDCIRALKVAVDRWCQHHERDSGERLSSWYQEVMEEADRSARETEEHNDYERRYRA